MKKILIITVTALFLGVIIYFGIIRGGFTYYTGIGTPYNYFAAKKASHDSLLILYDLPHDVLYTGNLDSLSKHYGFIGKTCYSDLYPHVLNVYDAVIKKEIHKRLGETKWKEYLYKRDSMEKKYELKLIVKPR